MTVGIMLLSQDNMYVDNHGRLPKRPDFDKELLVALVKGQKFTCSENTFKDLPDSIMKNAYYTEGRDYDINLGVKSFKNNGPHLLIVTRSEQYIHNGKHFSLKEYNRYFEGQGLEIWIKKTYKD